MKEGAAVKDKWRVVHRIDGEESVLRLQFTHGFGSFKCRSTPELADRLKFEATLV
jgi:hypothetical protein